MRHFLRIPGVQLVGNWSCRGKAWNQKPGRSRRGNGTNQTSRGWLQMGSQRPPRNGIRLNMRNRRLHRGWLDQRSFFKVGGHIEVRFLYKTIQDRIQKVRRVPKTGPVATAQEQGRVAKESNAQDEFDRSVGAGLSLLGRLGLNSNKGKIFRKSVLTGSFLMNFLVLSR